jgi:hypothetical protein
MHANPNGLPAADTSQPWRQPLYKHVILSEGSNKTPALGRPTRRAVVEATVLLSKQEVERF